MELKTTINALKAITDFGEVIMPDNYNHKYTYNIDEPLTDAITRLEALLPKPDFYVGWRGKTRSGLDVEILKVGEDRLIGARTCDGLPDTWQACQWSSDGNPCHVDGLVPNTPPEPEIWYRDPRSNVQSLVRETFLVATNQNLSNWEKVEVRIVPCR